MTDDELIASTFDEVKTTTVKIVNGKPYVSDEETIREMEFAEACDEYVRAARKFEKLDRIAKAQKGVPDNLCAWFDALEEQYQADKKLWLLFVGADRSQRSNLMYCEYRKMLLSGGKLRADA
ncbi:MAG TPA: hypothetical protein VEI01_22280 [Terriglobales bacterium]|nr:hypothetical protein [Terriglobales bacterium]